MPASTDDVRALASRLQSPALVLFPVRHHSPACAWQLRQLIAAQRPGVVLVEGPRMFDPMVPALADPNARMPLAVYAWSVLRGRDGGPDRRRSAYFPFCDHSPELVAIREATALGVPVRFIDLDPGEQHRLDEDAEEATDDDRRSLLDERQFARSARLQALAERLGCRDHEELWETLFELPAGNLPLDEHLARVTAYCQLSRLDSDADELRADGTLAREAEMAWHIGQALAQRREGDGPVLAVVGGFHAVALPALLADPPPRPRPTGGAVIEQDAALIRYDFERLDRLNGYGAGMASPAWQQAIWEQLTKRGRGDDVGTPRGRRAAALAMLADIAVELRAKHGHPLPLPALASAYEMALRLATLRGRPAPARNDVLDAVTSCFIQGDADADGAIVQAVARRAFTGVASGTVPPGAAAPPLVRDVAWRLRRQRLRVEDSQPRRLVLDIWRRPAHRLTSRLLHGLSLLGVPFALRTAGPDFVHRTGLDRLQEHWEYSYTAASEAALVEASVYGSTLPLAVATKFTAHVQRLQGDGEASTAGAGAALMTQACVLGLHDHLPRLGAWLRGAIGADAAFASVVQAASGLGLLWEAREPLEARTVGELPSLLRAAFERAIYLGCNLPGQGGPPDEAVAALTQLRELLVGAAGQELDAALYWEMLVQLQGSHPEAQVRGAAAGLRHAADVLPDDELAALVDGHLRGLAQPRQAVAFLRGLLGTAREAAWQQPTLLKVLDDLLSGWDEATFVANLPDLRLAFALMTPKETDRIAGAVAQLHGLEDLGPLLNRDVGADEIQANLALTRVLAAVLAEDGLAGWVAP